MVLSLVVPLLLFLVLLLDLSSHGGMARKKYRVDKANRAVRTQEGSPMLFGATLFL